MGLYNFAPRQSQWPRRLRLKLAKLARRRPKLRDLIALERARHQVQCFTALVKYYSLTPITDPERLLNLMGNPEAGQSAKACPTRSRPKARTSRQP